MSKLYCHKLQKKEKENEEILTPTPTQSSLDILDTSDNSPPNSKQVNIIGTKNRYEIKKRMQSYIPFHPTQRKVISSNPQLFSYVSLSPTPPPLPPPFQSSSSLSSSSESPSTFSSSFSLLSMSEQTTKKKEEKENELVKIENPFDPSYQLELLDLLITHLTQTMVEEKEFPSCHFQMAQVVFLKKEIMKKLYGYRQQDVLKMTKERKEKENSRTSSPESFLSSSSSFVNSQENETPIVKKLFLVESSSKLPKLQKKRNQEKKESIKDKKEKEENEKEKENTNELAKKKTCLQLLDVLHLMKEKENKCLYCNCSCFLFYENVRDLKQWTLDRIDNDQPHVIENVVLACLECNIIRRKRSMQKFQQGKITFSLQNHQEPTGGTSEIS